MPRRRGEEAERAIKRERWNKWRVLIRNPEFQKDIRALRRFYLETPGFYGQAPVNLIEKWGVVWDARQRLRDPETPDLTYTTVKLYETFFQDEPIMSAVSSYDLYGGPYDEWIPPPGVRPGEVLVIQADLNYPVGDLMVAIENHLRAAIENRPKQVRSGSLSGDRQRHRHDKLGRQLEVFDQYMNGDPTRLIAKSLGCRVGTVRSALAVAMRLTGVQLAKHGRAWDKDHISKCPTCGRKKRIDYDCPIVSHRIRKQSAALEARLKEIDETFVPPLPVRGEKSAFAKWDAKHPSHRRAGQPS